MGMIGFDSLKGLQMGCRKCIRREEKLDLSFV